MKKFGLIGACGYIAPRHLMAINDTGNATVVAYDPMDSVGILDKYTKDVAYFKTYEEFYYHIKTVLNKTIDYISICSPNYLHKTHCLLAMEAGAHAICEKPLVLNVEDLKTLKKIEQETGNSVYTILQLRSHEAIQQLKKTVDSEKRDAKHQLDLTYITSRGPWYHQTWKAQEKKAGGIAANIGIHFFDMLTWVFGSCQKMELHYRDQNTMSGYLELEKAEVKWFLSIDAKHLPAVAQKAGKPTYRSILLEGQEIEFSEGFTDLHTQVYKEILNGKGYGLNDVEEAIGIAEQLRGIEITDQNARSHKFILNR